MALASQVIRQRESSSGFEPRRKGSNIVPQASSASVFYE
jgi:hypothetical protein